MITRTETLNKKSTWQNY